MMRSILRSFGLLECCRYNNDRDLLDLSRKQVTDLEVQNRELLGQIQELKAINHYQAFDLEKTIDGLQNRIKNIEKEKFSLMGKLGYFKKHPEKAKAVKKVS